MQLTHDLKKLIAASNVIKEISHLTALIYTRISR